jgi:hypothetical protein
MTTQEVVAATKRSNRQKSKENLKLGQKVERRVKSRISIDCGDVFYNRL